jgi:hypothetical protein
MCVRSSVCASAGPSHEGLGRRRRNAAVAVGAGIYGERGGDERLWMRMRSRIVVLSPNVYSSLCYMSSACPIEHAHQQLHRSGDCLMSRGANWGRWSLEGTFLVYHADDRTPDPAYELDTSHLESTQQVEHWIEHLRTKSWIHVEDLNDLATACADIIKERLVDEAHTPGPEAMSELEYQEAVAAEWARLLATADPRDEPIFQRFLEQHPILLPGPYGTTHGRYHGVLFNTVFTQPELPGFRAKRPDFLLFDQDSGRTFAVLIEIEAPGKKWATKKGTPTADLTRGIDQLRDWKMWFSEPGNVLAFRELYKLDPEQFDTRRLVQHYVLIYGRREEVTYIESFARKRHSYMGADEFLMTYDRLEPNGSAHLTVNLDRSGVDTKLRLVSVTPTFRLERKNAEAFSMFSGREEAIQNQSLLSEERKQFLLERMKFADRYAEKMRRLRQSQAHPISLWQP